MKEGSKFILPHRHFIVRYALLYIQLVKSTYPNPWNSPFSTLIDFIKTEENTEGMVTLIVLTLEFFNDEIVDNKSHKCDQDLIRANEIKNHMREHDVALIIDFCKQILENKTMFSL